MLLGNTNTFRALEEGDQGFRIPRAGFKSENRPGIQGSNFISHEILSEIQISKWISRIHFLKKAGIQDSNLNPRKMAGIQDSNLVF